MVCKFCGRKIQTEKYTAPASGGRTCGVCAAYCTKQCEIGKSGKAPGWHFEPCLSCEKNPYNKPTT